MCGIHPMCAAITQCVWHSLFLFAKVFDIRHLRVQARAIVAVSMSMLTACSANALAVCFSRRDVAAKSESDSKAGTQFIIFKFQALSSRHFQHGNHRYIGSTNITACIQTRS